MGEEASSITTTTTTTATATAVAVAVNVPKYRSNLERRLGWLSDKRHAIMKPMKSFGSRKIDEKILNQIKMDVARSFGQFESSPPLMFTKSSIIKFRIRYRQGHL